MSCQEQILEGLRQHKVDEAITLKENKVIAKRCEALLKMIDKDVDITAKKKLQQILMYSESEVLKTDISKLEDAMSNLDLFLKTIAKLEV